MRHALASTPVFQQFWHSALLLLAGCRNDRLAQMTVDAPPYSYRGRGAFADFFRGNLLGTRVQYTIKPGAPQTEDRVGDHAYLEFVVNVRATDSPRPAASGGVGSASPGPRSSGIIGACGRHFGRWKIAFSDARHARRPGESMRGQHGL